MVKFSTNTHFFRQYESQLQRSQATGIALDQWDFQHFVTSRCDKLEYNLLYHDSLLQKYTVFGFLYRTTIELKISSVIMKI